MPYQSLLHSETRKQLGIDIENTVVVFDEAHNVFEAVTQMHNCSMAYSGGSSLQEVIRCLKSYLERYVVKSSGNDVFAKKGLSGKSQQVLLDLIVFTN